MVGICYGQNTAKPIYAKGVEYAAQGKFQEAKKEFEKALMFDPFYATAKRALQVIEDIIDQNIKNQTAIHIFKGISYYPIGQWGNEIDEFNKAIEINPSYAYAYFMRGCAYGRKGRYDQAISDYSKALELNPRDAYAYNNRGLAYAQGKGQFDKAISDYNKAIEINPKGRPGFSRKRPFKGRR
jgi:tetratricopeptide (TPR) repeat protein